MIGIIWGSRRKRGKIPGVSLGVEWGNLERDRDSLLVKEEEDEAVEEEQVVEEESIPEEPAEVHPVHIYLPTRSEKSFFSSLKLSKEERSLLMFKETIQIHERETHKEIGEAFISLEDKDGDILAHSHANFKYWGYEMGYSFTSTIKNTFSTHDEVRTEYFYDGTNKEFSRLFVAEDNNELCFRTTYCFDGSEHTHERTAALEIKKQLMLEGANVIFLRYLARHPIEDPVELLTVDINGTFSVCTYTYRKISVMIVHGDRVPVIAIERRFLEQNGRVNAIHYLMTVTGQLLKVTWNNALFYFLIHPGKPVHKQLKELYLDPPIPLELRWEDDMQLYSMFQDKVSERISSYRSYLVDCPQVKDVIVDFMNAVLLIKPFDVIQFAANHFIALDAPGERLGRLESWTDQSFLRSFYAQSTSRSLHSFDADLMASKETNISMEGVRETEEEWALKDEAAISRRRLSRYSEPVIGLTEKFTRPIFFKLQVKYLDPVRPSLSRY